MIEKDTYFIGWDVGGWNCDRNPRSRDAIVILDQERRLVGRSWRGNLRRLINEARSTQAWITGLFALCQAGPPAAGSAVILGIDSPLAFSRAFRDLVARGQPLAQALGDSPRNPYLYRRTEQELFAHGLRPLSAVKDLIGSQATKSMHVLARFAPRIASCGVWTDGVQLTALEVYPSACKHSVTTHTLRAGYGAFPSQDEEDALLCALLAALYAARREVLWNPPADMPEDEGWIWVPLDVRKP